jgi:predicted ATPase
VTDFGPIRKSGQVEIRPLTVFVGPSNAGKSYLATVVYALLNGISERRGTITRLADTTRYRLPPGPDAEATGALLTWLKSRSGRDLLRIQSKESGLPPAVGRYTESCLSAVAEGHARGLPAEIERCFGAPLPTLLRTGTKRAAVQLTIEHSPGINLRVSASASAVRTTSAIRNLSESDVRMKTLKGIEGNGRLRPDESDSARRILVDASYGLAAELTSPLPPDSYYLPAARSSLMDTSRILAREVLSRSARVPTNGKDRTPDLRGVVADFLANLVGMRWDEVVTTNMRLVAALEESIVQGKIELEDAPGPHSDVFYAPASGGRLPIRLAGSMVSELAPIALFLRHLATPGDLLIIEEPEAHLHPESQLKFAATIGQIVRAGVRVLITTHSDLLLGRINNLIASHWLSDEQKKEQGIGLADSIDPGNVAAYLFDHAKRQSGTIVRRLAVSDAEGIPEDVFTGVLEQLYSETIRIGSEIGQTAPASA